MPVKKRKQNYEIICQDAIKWLKKQPEHSLENIITGIPDMEETGFNYKDYYDFFLEASKLCLTRTKKNGYTIFMNTDRKFQGQWLDKSHWFQTAIQELPMNSRPNLKWHKIILLRPPNSTHIQRPTYQHYLCFSYEKGPGEATPDVINCGTKLYKNASCPIPTQHSLEFLKRYSNHQNQIVDPFVGRGTTLIEAKKMGFINGIGVDLDPKQCKKTRQALEKIK